MSATRPCASSSCVVRYLILVLVFTVFVFRESGCWLTVFASQLPQHVHDSVGSIFAARQLITTRGLNRDYTTKSPSDDFTKALLLSGRLRNFNNTKLCSQAANLRSSRNSSSVPLTLVLSRLELLTWCVSGSPDSEGDPYTGPTDFYTLTILILRNPGFEPITTSRQNHSTTHLTPSAVNRINDFHISMIPQTV